ncbi:MAG TPA: VOC family protein [Stellaceae bacterium]|jgi:catechol 2,3-dioxygenase-like lactoylglutathione lyase family enzyme|nr:VOC family protein [Stellaceae bacterium]
MALSELNHVTVRTKDLDGTRDFYVGALGMRVGDRPDLGFPGYWLYVGKSAVLHLVPESAGIGAGPSEDTGNFDHIAFLAGDYDGTCRHLDALGVEFRKNDVPRARLRQLFLTDPNRVMIELNFPMDA